MGGNYYFIYENDIQFSLMYELLEDYLNMCYFSFK